MKSQISNYNKISISKHSWLKAAKSREESLVIPQLNATGLKVFFICLLGKGPAIFEEISPSFGTFELVT